MSFLSLTHEDEIKALKKIGVHTADDLFSSIPPQIRENSDFKLNFDAGFPCDINEGLTEHELRKYFSSLASKNGSSYTHFLGGGVYDNIIPSIVNQLVLRGEFLTSYTPYQPEVSQGTLQAIFEFQTLFSRMTQMEVSNASMYDGATATAEAVLMAERVSGIKGGQILMADSLHPEYIEVSHTFLRNHSPLPTPISWSREGTLDLECLKELLQSKKPYAIVVGSPNYFGLIEPLDEIRAILPPDCLFIVATGDPSSYSIFEPPGAFQADIVVGEAHQLGTPMVFGGPHVGFFSTRKKFLRQMPGRLVGETRDSRGERAYTLTLSTREQHIRREKATSNICTNQGLIALRTTIYLSFLGKMGFYELGEINHSLFQALTEKLENHGIRRKFKNSIHYREGVFNVPHLKKRFSNALNKKIIPGIILRDRSTRFQNEEFENSILISVHPKHTESDLDALVEVLSRDS